MFWATFSYRCSLGERDDWAMASWCNNVTCNIELSRKLFINALVVTAMAKGKMVVLLLVITWCWWRQMDLLALRLVTVVMKRATNLFWLWWEMQLAAKLWQPSWALWLGVRLVWLGIITLWHNTHHTRDQGVKRPVSLLCLFTLSAAQLWWEVCCTAFFFFFFCCGGTTQLCTARCVNPPPPYNATQHTLFTTLQHGLKLH